MTPTTKHFIIPTVQKMTMHIDAHTLERAEERGTTKEEIEEVIKNGFVIAAKYGRLGKAKIYNFKKIRNNKYYEQKRVEVYYFLEGEAVKTVTVYVFYGKWEGLK